MNCPNCALSSEPASLRHQLLGAVKVYMEADPCPLCGFESERAKHLALQRYNLWVFCFGHELPPEQRRPEWERRERLRKLFFPEYEE